MDKMKNGIRNSHRKHLPLIPIALSVVVCVIFYKYWIVSSSYQILKSENMNLQERIRINTFKSMENVQKLSAAKMAIADMLHTNISYLNRILEQKNKLNIKLSENFADCNNVLDQEKKAHYRTQNDVHDSLKKEQKIQADCIKDQETAKEDYLLKRTEAKKQCELEKDDILKTIQAKADPNVKQDKENIRKEVTVPSTRDDFIANKSENIKSTDVIPLVTTKSVINELKVIEVGKEKVTQDPNIIKKTLNQDTAAEIQNDDEKPDKLVKVIKDKDADNAGEHEDVVAQKVEQQKENLLRNDVIRRNVTLANDKHTEQHKDKHTDERADKHADKRADKHDDKHDDKHADEHAEQHTDEHADKHTDERADKHTDERADKHTDERADKHTDERADKHAEQHTARHVEEHEDDNKTELNVADEDKNLNKDVGQEGVNIDDFNNAPRGVPNSMKDNNDDDNQDNAVVAHHGVDVPLDIKQDSKHLNKRGVGKNKDYNYEGNGDIHEEINIPS